jgi:tryptophan synthase alpha chain
LRHHVSLADVIKLVRRIRRQSEVPICLMLSYNLVIRYGQDKFYADCAKAGVDGVIIPDLSPVTCHQAPVTTGDRRPETVCLVAPTSSEQRIKMIAEKSKGFIYLISTTGITGKRTELAAGLKELVKRIRNYSRLPIAVGFGIATPAQAAEAAKAADGVIVGSAIVDLIGQKKLKAVPKLVASLRRALDCR